MDPTNWNYIRWLTNKETRTIQWSWGKEKQKKNWSCSLFARVYIANIDLLLCFERCLEKTLIWKQKNYQAIRSTRYVIWLTIKKLETANFLDSRLPHFDECQKMINYIFEKDVKERLASFNEIFFSNKCLNYMTFL